MTAPAFSLQGVEFGYRRGRTVLRDLDIQINAGDFIGLIGPNGAGKSTLLHLLTGWNPPTRGRVELHGRAIDSYTRLDLARQIAVVPQREDHCFSFTVEEVVLLGRYAHHPQSLSFEDDADRAIAREAIASVDLVGFESRPAEELSAGERQRMLIARALAQQAPIMLLDEPTASLDLFHQREILSLLSRLNRERGLTIIMVSHDLNLAAMFCRELILLADGRVVARGTPPQVLTPETLAPVYRVPLTVRPGEDGIPLIQMRRDDA